MNELLFGAFFFFFFNESFCFFVLFLGLRLMKIYLDVTSLCGTVRMFLIMVLLFGVMGLCRIMTLKWKSHFYLLFYLFRKKKIVGSLFMFKLYSFSELIHRQVLEVFLSWVSWICNSDPTLFIVLFFFDGRIRVSAW